METLLDMLLTLRLLSPTEAAEEAAEMVGYPEMYPELIRICKRESVGRPYKRPCQPIGIHERDVAHGYKMYWAGVRKGWIDVRCQPYKHGWSSRGPWGLMAALHLHLLPFPCLDPELMDIPMVSAWLAATKLKNHCETPKGKRKPWNLRWGRCWWFDGVKRRAKRA